MKVLEKHLMLIYARTLQGIAKDEFPDEFYAGANQEVVVVNNRILAKSGDRYWGYMVDEAFFFEHEPDIPNLTAIEEFGVLPSGGHGTLNELLEDIRDCSDAYTAEDLLYIIGLMSREMYKPISKSAKHCEECGEYFIPSLKTICSECEDKGKQPRKMRGITDNIEVTELCPHCDKEVTIFQPEYQTYAKCPECGGKMLPCSLCDSDVKCSMCARKEK